MTDAEPVPRTCIRRPANRVEDAFDPLEPDLPGLTVVDQGARYAFLNGTSMVAPHAAGVAALIRQLHPNWSPGAVAAALERSATPLACPADWQPLNEDDDRERCYGSVNRNSFFGAGLINAKQAAQLYTNQGGIGSRRADIGPNLGPTHPARAHADSTRPCLTTVSRRL